MSPSDGSARGARSRSPAPSACSTSASLGATSCWTALEELIGERLPEVQVRRYMKPTFTKPAPDELLRKMAGEVDFVIEGLAD